MTKTIILIHGYGFDHRIWYPVELAFEGYHFIYLSLPGFGDDADAEAYTIESLARTYWSEIDPVLSPHVHLVGHSMGGYVCMEMAAQQPARVASVALVHSHVFPDSAEKKLQRTVTMDGIRSDGRESLVRKMIPSLFGEGPAFKEIIDALITRGMSYTDDAWLYGTQAIRDRKDHTETLKSLKVPVLMIAGEKDKAVPLELIYKQSPLPTHNSLVIYPGVGHMSMYENTAALIGDLSRFYTGLQ